MRVSVFGVGHVGCVTAACLSKAGHEVIGVDVDRQKVKRLNAGQATVVEPDLDRLIAEGVQSGLLSATTDAAAAVRASDVTIICVGTPNRSDGGLDLGALESTACTIGRALQLKRTRHSVIVRSTVPPGTTECVVRPRLIAERFGGSIGLDVFVVPEFLREGSAVADYYHPPLRVIGCEQARSRKAAEIGASLFGWPAPHVQVVGYREAEFLKVVCNAFHALKVAFANEVGALCSSLSLDGRKVMDMLVQDTTLNISAAYLRPGLPFGGSCLPKDVRSMVSLARRRGVEAPLLEAVLDTNEAHIQRAVEVIQETGLTRIGLVGLAFKSDTDDLRNSPLVAIAEHLTGKGYDLRILDRGVERAVRTGVQEGYRHLTARLASASKLLDHAEVLVLGRHDAEVAAQLQAMPERPVVVDLTDGFCPGVPLYEGALDNEIPRPTLVVTPTAANGSVAADPPWRVGLRSGERRHRDRRIAS